MGDLLAIKVAVALFPEEGFDLLHGVLIGGVQLKQLSYHGSLLLVNDKAAVLLAVAEDAAVAQHHIILDGLLMAEFHAAAELTQLILRDRGHDGQPQLGVLVKGVDIVVLEEYAHATAKKLPRKLDGVQCITCKTGDLLGDDKVKGIIRRVIDHAVEVLTALGGDTGQALINVAGDKRPRGVPADEVLVVLDLVAQ